MKSLGLSIYTENSTFVHLYAIWHIESKAGEKEGGGGLDNNEGVPF